MTKKIEIENLDSLPKSVWGDDGVKYTLEPHEVKQFNEPVANNFLATFPRWTKVFIPTNLPRFAEEPLVWVANVTGNVTKVAAKTIRKLKTNKESGKEDWEEVPNPKLDPKCLHFEMQASQIYTDKGAVRDSFTPPPIRFKFPPYHRLPTSTSIANYMLGLDAAQPQASDTGNIIACRPPSAFEPNATWEYDDMRLYAHMVDETEFSQEVITKEYPPARLVKADDMEELRTKLWRHLFFFLVDDRYSLPTEAAFRVRKSNAIKANKQPVVQSNIVATSA